MPRARIRCYKCLKTGHAIDNCQEETDRGRRCFNCGETGHSADQCAREARCVLCLNLEQESTHRLGSYKCAYPSFLSRREIFGDNRFDSNYNYSVRLERDAYEGRRSFAKSIRRGMSESDSYYQYQYD